MLELRRWIYTPGGDRLLIVKSTISTTELATFATVVRLGSFTRAAEALASSKANVSRVVSRLERRHGVQLLHRSTRSLSTTEEGSELYERASAILLALEDAEAALGDARDKPSGRLRVVAGTEYGPLVVGGWISAYLARYPAVRVDAAFTNRLDDIVQDGIDVAIRVGRLPDSELVARRLGEMRYRLCASHDYLAAHGMPDTPEALARHRRIVFTPRRRRDWSAWALVHEGDSDAPALRIDGEPHIAVNNQFLAHRLALDGHGIALLPLDQSASDIATGRLVTVLPGWSRVPVPVHALYTASRYRTPKVRRFVELCVERFPEPPSPAGLPSSGHRPDDARS